MIELMEFLNKLVKKVPDYREPGRIYIDVDGGGYTLVVSSLRANSILYRFERGSTIHDWNPRGAAFYRYSVDKLSVVHLNNDTRVLGQRLGGVRIQVSKVFWKEARKYD